MVVKVINSITFDVDGVLPAQKIPLVELLEAEVCFFDCVKSPKSAAFPAL